MLYRFSNFKIENLISKINFRGDEVNERYFKGSPICRKMIENGQIDEDLSLYFFQRYMKIVTGKADRATKILVKLLATSRLLESPQKMPLLSILMVGKKFGSMKELTKMATESVSFFKISTLIFSRFVCHQRPEHLEGFYQTVDYFDWLSLE